MPDPSPIAVGIVPHTHWDREWHTPFEALRVRLVHLLDGLLDLLERDDDPTRFLLDGQTTLLDDYLAVRPEAEDRIRSLVIAGRLTIGPWTVLMDEFMVSPETIVRNLQRGMRRADELGGTMAVGYLPDMFGHVAQMPQILRGAGIGHAVVWRGVPAAIRRTAFWWEAPDGSRVRAEYLYGSYSNGRELPDRADGLVARAQAYADELGDVALPGGDLLLMNGSDHLPPQPHLGAVVAAANAAQAGLRFAVTSLPEHLARQSVEGLAAWTGELRSGARAPVLMGTASNRVDVHRAAAAAERAVEGTAEPAAALFGAPTDAPTALLDVAWQELLRNSAHDSSCACSVDEVVDEVLVRYARARQIGAGVAADAVAALAASVDAPPGAVIVANLVGVDHAVVVELTVPTHGDVSVTTEDGAAVHTQVVAERAPDALDATVVGDKIAWVLGLISGDAIAGTRVGRIERTTRDDGSLAFHFVGTSSPDDAVDLRPVRDELQELGARGTVLRLRVTRAPERTVLAAVPAVPGFGWRTVTAGPARSSAGADAVRRGGAADPAPVVATDHPTAELDNGRARVEIDPDGNGFSVEAEGVRVTGLGRLVDGGDGGDTYNYSPPGLDRTVDAPVRSSWFVEERGPVRGRIVLERTYEWPVEAIGDERACTRRNDTTVEVAVRTTLELRAGEPFVRVRTELDNPCRDHRLRAHLPLPAAVTGTDSGCAFAVVHRGLTAEGGPHEAGLPTFVSRRFVDASDGRVGLAVLHDLVLEHEVVDDGRELALTLLRATGYLSRAEPSLRPNPAGPTVPLRGAQMLGPVVCDYALLPHRGSWEDAALHARADELVGPVLTATVPPAAVPSATGSSATGRRPATGQALRVAGAEVSAVTRGADGLVVRVYNPAAGPSRLVVEVDGVAATGSVVDLRDRVVEPFAGTRDLRGGEIVTLRLR